MSLAGVRAMVFDVFGTVVDARPTEHGPGQTTDLRPEQDWDVVAEDFVALADLCPASFGRAR